MDTVDAVLQFYGLEECHRKEVEFFFLCVGGGAFPVLKPNHFALCARGPSRLPALVHSSLQSVSEASLPKTSGNRTQKLKTV